MGSLNNMEAKGLMLAQGPGGSCNTCPIIDNNQQAISHYFSGKGQPVQIGPRSFKLAQKNKDFLFRHKRIVAGMTTRMEGHFGIDMTKEMFHIGDTRVDYSISCTITTCSVTYTFFSRDGYWDVNFPLEYVAARFLPADGKGPLYEVPGGTPYNYVPISITHNFPNPGYKPNR